MTSDAEEQDFAPLTLRQTAESWLGASFGFDIRSLAALRIVAPGFYLWELLTRWKLLEAFYSDAGLLPRTMIFDNVQHGYSLYFAVGSLTGARFLFLLHLLALICVIVGWRTRLASLICYVFVISLQNRFPALPGWETEIRSLFLIGAFLPWGDCASIDAWLRGKQGGKGPSILRSADQNGRVVSLATLAWRLQVAATYLVSGLLKVGPGWGDGTAVEVSLISDGYSTWIGHWFLNLCQHHPGSLVGLNYAVPVFEACAPLLLLSPWPTLQMACVVGLWFMHAAFGLCLNIGMFSQICSGCLICFVPAWFWDRFKGARLPQRSANSSRLRLHVAESIFLTWVCLSIVVASIQSVLAGKKSPFTANALAPWATLGLEQRWGMFVPPPFDGGWHVIRGKTFGGQWVDLFHARRELTEDKPEWPYKVYPSVHTYLFMALELRAKSEDKKYLHQAIADYYRRIWERAHPSAEDRISDCEIVYFNRTYAPGEGFKEITRTVVYSHTFP